MPDLNDLHRFYEANLSEYKRKDLVAVTAFFVEQIGANKGKPLREALKNWKRLRQFVAIEWQGAAEISNKPLPVVRNQVAAPVKEDYGACPCGGRMVKRQNATKKNYFLGCSNYPKCKNTNSL